MILSWICCLEYDLMLLSLKLSFKTFIINVLKLSHNFLKIKPDDKIHLVP